MYFESFLYLGDVMTCAGDWVVSWSLPDNSGGVVTRCKNLNYNTG